MRKLTLMLVLLTFGTTYVYAQGSNHHNNNQTVNVGSIGDTQSVTVDPQQSVNVGPQTQGQSQSVSVGPQSQTVNANSQAGATATGNVASQSLSITTPHRAPAVFGGYVFPTAACESAGGAGASWLTGGLNFSGTRRNKWCQKLETARLLFEMGNPRAAQQLICTIKFVKEEKNVACAPFADGEWKWFPFQK